MRNPDRIDEIILEVARLWKKYPDLRLGQLLCNVLRDPALYYVEDADLIAALKEYYGEE